MKNKTALSLTFIYTVVLAQIGSEIQLLFLGVLFLLASWNGFLALKGKEKPATLTANIMALVCLVALLLTVGFKDSVQLFVAMLLLACLFKLLQLRTDKDYNQLMVLTFFSITTVFIYRQSIQYAFICGLLYALNLALLLSYHSRTSLRKSINYGIKTIMMSFPVAALLLILMPHLPSFWRLPGPGVTKTGLSESVNPFNIAKLTKSDELAFRVIFPQKEPTPPFYWRAIIHDSFDGNSWNIATLFDAMNTVREPVSDNFMAGAISYRVITEQAAHRHLYGMNYAKSTSANVLNLNTGLMERRKQTGSGMQYTAYSKPLTDKNKALSSSHMRHYKRLPAENNEQTRQFARDMRSQYPDSEVLVGALLNYFRDNKFVYSLTPTPVSGRNQIDDFLFETKNGFCGHYASASAFILREVGIPARLVSGYLGGEKKPERNYYSVYQYDAHAWVEYWIENKGWQRFDPTGVLVPDRLTGSLSQLTDTQEEFIDNLDFGFTSLSHFAVFSWLKETFEMLDYNWTVWVLGYDRDRQESLLSRLFGSKSVLNGALAALASCALILFGYFAFLTWQKRDRSADLLAKEFKRLQQAGNSAGVEFVPGTTPLAYCRLLSGAYPSVADLLAEFSTLYNDVRYRNQPLEKTSEYTVHKLVNNIIKTIKRTQ